MLIGASEIDATTQSDPRALGLALVLGAVSSEAAFAVTSKRLASGLPPLTLTACATLAGFLLSLPLALGDVAAFDAAAVPAAAWLTMVYYGVVATALSYFLWYAGLARVTGVAATPFLAVPPLAAIALSAMALDEFLSLAGWAGAICVVAAIFIAVAPRKRQAVQPKRSGDATRTAPSSPKST